MAKKTDRCEQLEEWEDFLQVRYPEVEGKP